MKKVESTSDGLLQLLAKSAGGGEKLFTLSPFSPFSRDTHTGLTFLGTNECLGRLTCSGTNRKGLGPKVLVGVRAVSRVGGGNTEVGMSEARGAPAGGERERE